MVSGVHERRGAGAGKLAPPVRLIGRVVLHRARHTNDWHAGKREVVSDT